MMASSVSMVATIVSGAAVLLSGCISVGQQADSSGDRLLGAVADLGNGTVSSYVEYEGGGTPTAIGLVFSATALEGLPGGSDEHQCYDRDKDDVIEPASECLEGHEFVIPLPDSVSRRQDIPFKWVLLNWNPHGHVPPGVYDLPHFDIHFFMAPIADVFALESGPCGPEFMRCDQYELARKPLPPNYMHADFKDVDAAVPAMGNHLVDLTSPELHGEVFTRTWIYGAYNGSVTFYEEMVTRAFILSQPRACFAIKTPQAVQHSGYYPTESCVRHDEDSDEHTVSMERFVFREASDPQPIAKGAAL